MKRGQVFFFLIYLFLFLAPISRFEIIFKIPNFLFSGLAALLQLYVEAINTPGAVPSVQSAWDTFVGVKCTEASQAALTIYDSLMNSGLPGRLPCDNDVIRQNHDAALEKGVAHLEDETAGLSAVTTEKVIRELTVSLVNIYNNVSP